MLAANRSFRQSIGRSPGDGRDDRRDIVAILSIVTFSAIITAALDTPMVRSDGFAYYLWLEALVRNHTMDLSAAARHYAQFITYQAYVDPQTGRYASPFAFGAAILWAPFYAVFGRIHGVMVAGIPLQDPATVTVGGQILVYSLSISFASWVYATIALVCWYAIARRILPVAPAAAVTIAIFLGTPLYYYTTFEPTMAHAVGTFAVTLAVWLIVRSGRLPLTCQNSRRGPDSERSREASLVQTTLIRVSSWGLVGLTIGLAGTIRWQLVLVAIPIGVLLLSLKQGKELLACAVGTALIFTPVPLNWLRMFGSPLPGAVGSVHGIWPMRWATVLFSPDAGMFVWSPITILSLIGLIVLAYRGQRRSALVLILAVAMQVWMNGMAGDGTGGASFGMRRMTEMDPIFVIGLAILIREARRTTWTKRSIYAATALCTLFTIGLFLTYVRGLIDPLNGTVLDAIAVWLPPHTSFAFNVVRTYHPFALGT